MNVFYGLDNLPVFKRAVLTIGTFDGVHAGHQAILKRVKQKAADIDGESVIITFEPHPRFVIASSEQSIHLLNTLDEKIANLQHLGIHHLVVVNFTTAFANMDAADYVRKFLVEKFHPHTLIIGFDHLFGKARKGDFNLLSTLSTVYHFELEEIPVQLIEENKISSTQIRQALQVGEVHKAALYLGQPYSLKGKVMPGRKLGRKLGFPTANIGELDKHKLIPAKGVYAVQAIVAGQTYGGMLNIGFNPTVTDAGLLSIEVHLFAFEADIYGYTINVRFIDRIRDEEHFSDLASLTAAMHRDRELALQILNNVEIKRSDEKA